MLSNTMVLLYKINKKSIKTLVLMHIENTMVLIYNYIIKLITQVEN